jgi:hypothetical protein
LLCKRRCLEAASINRIMKDKNEAVISLEKEPNFN